MQTRAERKDIQSSSAEVDRALKRDVPMETASFVDLWPDAAAQRQRSGLANAGRRMDRQRMAAETIQRKSDGAAAANRAGLADGLKAGIESVPGISMDGMRVHHNSPQPAQLDAHAYAHGTENHSAPGQKRHMPHEAWHVVQQAHLPIKPTMLMNGGVPVNQDVELEAESDVMGAKAVQHAHGDGDVPGASPSASPVAAAAVQRMSVVQFAGTNASAGKFIAGDQVAPGAGQVDKGTFLTVLKESVREMADRILAEIGQGADGCPYISYWFTYYDGRDISHIEEAIGRYAPAAMSAVDWRECIREVTQEVRRAFESHVATGSKDGVPEGLPDNLERNEPAPSVAEPAQPASEVVQLCGAGGDTDSKEKPARAISVQPGPVAKTYTLDDVKTNTKHMAPGDSTLKSMFDLKDGELAEVFGLEEDETHKYMDTTLAENNYPFGAAIEQGRVEFHNYFGSVGWVMGENFKDKVLAPKLYMNEVVAHQSAMAGVGSDIKYLVRKHVISKDGKAFFDRHGFADKAIMTDEQRNEFLGSVTNGKSSMNILLSKKLVVTNAQVLVRNGEKSVVLRVAPMAESTSGREVASSSVLD